MVSLADFVFEALTRSYSAEKLSKQISKKYDIPLKSISHRGQGDEAEIIMFQSDENLEDDKEFEKLIEFFGYYITLCKGHMGKYDITLEPYFSKKINKEIYDDCDGKIYVLLRNSRIEQIKKYGLKVNLDDAIDIAKSEYRQNKTKENRKKVQDLRTADRRVNTSYRRFSSRIFFFAGPDKKALFGAFNEVKEELRIPVSDLNDAWSVVEIDLKKSKLNVDCYEDIFQRVNDWKKVKWHLLYINGDFKPNTFERVVSGWEFLQEFKGIKDADEYIEIETNRQEKLRKEAERKQRAKEERARKAAEKKAGINSSDNGNKLSKLKAVTEEAYNKIIEKFPNTEIGNRGGLSATYDIDDEYVKGYLITFTEKDSILTIRYARISKSTNDLSTPAIMAKGSVEEAIDKAYNWCKKKGLKL